MTQQNSEHPSNSNDLLSELESTRNSSLENSVIEREGVNGSLVQPVYSVRKMRCYSVTESELKQIGLANIAMTAFFSLGSTCLAFAVDIFKDTSLAESVPSEAQTAISYIQPILIFFMIAFYVLGCVSIWWRWGMVKTIKEESARP